MLSEISRKIVVTGSREFSDITLARNALLSAEMLLQSDNNTVRPQIELIHGAAKGADTICAYLVNDDALFTNWSATAYPANWTIHGRGAGLLRNRQMLALRPDLVLAFPMHPRQSDRAAQVGSRGTWHTVDTARLAHLPVLVAYQNVIWPANELAVALVQDQISPDRLGQHQQFFASDLVATFSTQ